MIAIDIGNSTVSIASIARGALGAIWRLATDDLAPAHLREALDPCRNAGTALIASGAESSASEPHSAFAVSTPRWVSSVDIAPSSTTTPPSSMACRSVTGSTLPGRRPRRASGGRLATIPRDEPSHPPGSPTVRA